jgi:hypothetical protein
MLARNHIRASAISFSWANGFAFSRAVGQGLPNKIFFVFSQQQKFFHFQIQSLVDAFKVKTKL